MTRGYRSVGLTEEKVTFVKLETGAISKNTAITATMVVTGIGVFLLGAPRIKPAWIGDHLFSIACFVRIKKSGRVKNGGGGTREQKLKKRYSF